MNDNRSSMAPVVLLSCLTGMCIVVGFLFFIEEPVGAHGEAHSQFASTMLKGDIGSDRLGRVRWLGLAFALLQTMFFVVSLLLGIRQEDRVLLWFAIGGILYATTLTALVVTESVYAQGGARDIVLGFPLPTAIMIYGVGGVPVIFSCFYVLRFDRWVLKPEDLQRINELAREQSQVRVETGN